MAFSVPFLLKDNQLEKWLHGFLTRNSEPTTGAAYGASHVRLKGHNAENVRKFLELYEPEFRKKSFHNHTDCSTSKKPA
jgi:hypothetical protein